MPYKLRPPSLYVRPGENRTLPGVCADEHKSSSLIGRKGDAPIAAPSRDPRAVPVRPHSRPVIGSFQRGQDRAATGPAGGGKPQVLG